MSRIASIVAPLFVPADRPERFVKAAGSGADAVILDLEDAVSPDRKEAARSALDAGFTDLPVIVRVNAAGTPWFEDDLAAVARLPIAAVMLPKADHAAPLARVAAVAPVIALVETVRGIADARAVASGGHVERLAFGSVDYAADLGCDHVRVALAAARAELVVASRLANLPQPLDGVTTDVADAAITQDDARHARALGFGGKLLIHPRQVPATRAGFMPGRDEIRWAERVLGSGDGAAAVDGAMVDEPVRIRARALLDRAERLSRLEQ
ncbi:HpcH/HpaI aldolase/citrate lyase family protein [Sphingomonas hankookensis]|uniref:CoA ester lyase n=1 Tax=Sphingomonas hengshuiensis TaxID=1609977 RepID=A0A2W5BFW4_9SPHN|nr:MAG: CoA ester lyase [Sphingomonas hengshuiensis]